MCVAYACNAFVPAAAAAAAACGDSGLPRLWCSAHDVAAQLLLQLLLPDIQSSL
jgi:hypothetical protein